MAEKALPSPEVLRQLLRFDADTGKLFWLERSPGTFADPYSAPPWNGRFAGKEAFTASDSDGYKIGMCNRKHLKAHRVVWALVHGAWPEGELDHEDGDRANNRIGNLRPASRSGQLQNVGLRLTNTSGYPGVSWHKRKRQWRAQITAGGVKTHLGYFDCVATADDAYRAAKARLHTFSPRLRA